EPLGNDRWEASLTPPELGRWQYSISAWVDRFASWGREVERKLDAGQADLRSELAEGAAILGVETLTIEDALAAEPELPHEADAPELGTVADLERLVATAAEHGVELALDLALQCSPDHPWLADHPEWFQRRPDGTLKYAENPPKRYQDIYNLNFDTEDWRG